MPFSDPDSHLHDLCQAIESIERFVVDMSFDVFQQDEKTVAAVERKVLVVSEAARRLGDDAERLCPGQPWRSIRNISNWLRHQYDLIDPGVIWTTVKRDLPNLGNN